jgi:hypothetical protein
MKLFGRRNGHHCSILLQHAYCYLPVGRKSEPGVKYNLRPLLPFACIDHSFARWI